MGTISDTGAEIHRAVTQAIEEIGCDIIMTSGGVSMGELDLIKPYIELQGEVFFGRLNMKPGKPTTFGRIQNCLVLALPGNPVSCFVSSSLFLGLITSVLATGIRRDKRTVEAKLLPQSVKVDPIRPEYHRCTVYRIEGSPSFCAISTGADLQQSSRLLSAVDATGLAILPAGNTMYRCNGHTRVVLLEDSEEDLPCLTRDELSQMER